MSYNIDIDLIPTCVAIYKKVDNDFIFVDFNKKAEKTEAITKEELLGQKLTNIFPGVKQFGLFDVLIRVERTGKNETFDTTFYKDKRISGYRKNKVVKLTDGNIVTFFSDTNEEKKLEDLLIEQRNMFQKVMYDSQVISVQGYNDNHEVIYWNKASEKIYGFTEEEAKGKKLEDLIIPDKMKKIVYQGIENWIHNEVEVPSSELTLLDKNGDDVYVYSQHKMVQIAINKHEIYCIDIDLSTTKSLQKELTSQRDYLRALLDCIPDLIWTKDLDGFYMSCNNQFEKFFGAKESDIIGKNDFNFVDKELAEFFRKKDKIAMRKGNSSINEEYLTFADGSYKGYFETIKTPIKNSRDETIGILGISRDVSLRKKYEKQLLAFANTDILTGLTNRAVLVDRLEQLLKHRESKKHHGAVLFIDLDNFKEVNDTKGHHIGDELLIEVSKRLKNIVRKGDTVARFGGDEFILLLEQVTTPTDASYVAKKALKLLKEPIFIKEYQLSISASIGIAIFPFDSKVSQKLISYADDAMYYVKKHGKDNYKFYGDIKKDI